MRAPVAGPVDPAELDRFLDSFMYRRPAFLVDEIVELDHDARRIAARMDEETKMAKAYRGGKFTLKELGTFFLSTSSDMTAANLASKGSVKFSNIMSDWGKKIDQGMTLLNALNIF